MEKKTLISFLESLNDSRVEMNNFIQAIYEVRPDIMELERKTPKGGMYDITDKSNPTKAIDDFSDEPSIKQSNPSKKTIDSQSQSKSSQSSQSSTDSNGYSSDELKSYNAIWKHNDGDQPVKILKIVGEYKGVKYYAIEGSNTALPENEIEFINGFDEKTLHQGDNTHQKDEDIHKEPQKDETPKALTIKSDIGYKRVADNDAFKNINEETYQPIADIFSLDEVKMINESVPTDWHEADRRLIMCKQVDYEDTSRKVINCYNGSNPTGLGRPNKFPREYITTFYDAVQSGKLKDANEVYTIFHVKDSYRSSPIHVLQLREKKGRNRYAIKFHVLGEESPYLMIGSELHTKFLFKIY